MQKIINECDAMLLRLGPVASSQHVPRPNTRGMSAFSPTLETGKLAEMFVLMLLRQLSQEAFVRLIDLSSREGSTS